MLCRIYAKHNPGVHNQVRKKPEIFLFERSSLPDALLVGQRNAKSPHAGTVGAEASIWLSTTPDRSVA